MGKNKIPEGQMNVEAEMFMFSGKTELGTFLPSKNKAFNIIGIIPISLPSFDLTMEWSHNNSA